MDNPVDRLRVEAGLTFQTAVPYSMLELRAILAHVDAQAAEIERLREQVALLRNVIARATLAQETQP
jgi:hypothetical protein